MSGVMVPLSLLLLALPYAAACRALTRQQRHMQAAWTLLLQTLKRRQTLGVTSCPILISTTNPATTIS